MINKISVLIISLLLIILVSCGGDNAADPIEYQIEINNIIKTDRGSLSFSYAAAVYDKNKNKTFVFFSNDPGFLNKGFSENEGFIFAFTGNNLIFAPLDGNLKLKYHNSIYTASSGDLVISSYGKKGEFMNGTLSANLVTQETAAMRIETTAFTAVVIDQNDWKVPPEDLP